MRKYICIERKPQGARFQSQKKNVLPQFSADVHLNSTGVSAVLGQGHMETFQRVDWFQSWAGLGRVPPACPSPGGVVALSGSCECSLWRKLSRLPQPLSLEPECHEQRVGGGYRSLSSRPVWSTSFLCPLCHNHCHVNNQLPHLCSCLYKVLII